MGGYKVSVPPGSSQVQVEVSGKRVDLTLDLSPEQARQFAAWLNQGADWVERERDLKRGRRR